MFIPTRVLIKSLGITFPLAFTHLTAYGQSENGELPLELYSAVSQVRLAWAAVF